MASSLAILLRNIKNRLYSKNAFAPIARASGGVGAVTEGLSMIRRILFSLALAGALLPCAATAFVVGSPPATPVAASLPSGTSPYELGFDAGFAQGFGEGLSTGVARCVANPATCGIAIKSGQTVSASAKYGETEPNDNIVAANPLVANADFYGQSYGIEDQDWFYVVTPRQNYTLTINFALADIAAGNLSGWRISIRNAVGMTFAEFDTGLTMVADTSKGLYYNVTLGLAGTYYIVVEPVASVYTQQRYRLRANMEPAANTNQNFVVNFYDAEHEPNNTPPDANRITPGVSMYGLISLKFDNPWSVQDNKNFWAQGESDWFVYKSEKGREIVQLSFCDRQACGAGNWLVQFYDQALVDAVMKAPQTFQDAFGNPFDPFDAAALVTFNTTSCGKDPCAETTTGQTSETSAKPTPEVWHFGIEDPGTYYIRVGHKRKFDAPCAGYETLTDPVRSCACEDGKSSCTTATFNANFKEIQTSIYPPCPDGSGGGQESLCKAQCLGGEITGHVDMDGNGIADGVICGCPGGKFPCTVKVKNPGEATPWSAIQYPVCPNGKDGFENNRLCPVQCLSSRGPGMMDPDSDGLPGEYCTCPNGTYPCTDFTDAAGTKNVDGTKRCFMTSGILDLDGNNLPDTGGLPDTGTVTSDIVRYACYCPEGKYPCTVTDPQTKKSAQCLAAKPGTEGTAADGLNPIACSCAGATSPGSDVGYPCAVQNPADPTGPKVTCLIEYPGQMDLDGDGLPESRPCDCAPNKFPCTVTTPNPSSPVSTTEPQYPICPNGDKIEVELGPDYGPELCNVNCIADNQKGQIDFNFDGLPDTELGRCNCASGDFPCPLSVPNPGASTPSIGYVFGACPDGSKGENDGAQCTVGCQCVRFGGMVEVPAGNISSQYNFTWTVNPKGTPVNGQVESTLDSEAYQDYLRRPSAY